MEVPTQAIADANKEVQKVSVDVVKLHPLCQNCKVCLSAWCSCNSTALFQEPAEASKQVNSGFCVIGIKVSYHHVYVSDEMLPIYGTLCDAGCESVVHVL